ncbi:hypothetical protein IC229_24185 [Spirosoma sp. BT702]|uniref:Uncharacterized protein n=1 Tax=Spirosoma profusum TaxID=2771354 RepID=A0A927AUD7_9BACT|nr:hypothetical protein [Spirosoma profusum]MBD2703767.1 hypothetical protein [Spirosoma profusum]
MKIKRLIFLSLLLANVIRCAWADVIPYDRRSVSYCFRLANINQYPKYVFIAYYPFPTPNYAIIKSGECVHFYHLSRPVICAIAKNHFREDSLRAYQQARNQSIRDKLQRYFESNPNLIRSDVKISAVSTLSKSNPTKSIEDVLTVKKLSGSTLQIDYDNVVYRYDDGTTEKKPYTEQDMRPSPSLKPKASSSKASVVGEGWLVAGGLSIVGLLSALFMRNRKR